MPQRHSRYATVGEYLPLHITATGTLVPVGRCVNTTASAITAGSNVVVTPASMNGITPGVTLNIANGTGTAEDVVVKIITSTTFTADFANNHSGSYNIMSRRQGTFVGRFVVNKAGTTDVITLYNGNPNLSSNAGSAIAVISAAYGTLAYECAWDAGLFYTVTGTPGDYTLMYLDMSV